MCLFSSSNSLLQRHRRLLICTLIACLDTHLEVRPKRKTLKLSFDLKKTLSGIGSILPEAVEKSLKDSLLEEMENTLPSRKESQGRSPGPSTEQTKMATGTSGSSTDDKSYLTTEELSELRNITTQTIRDNFNLDSGYRRDWMERTAVLDTTSRFEGPGNFSTEDSEDDGFNENFSYVNCDSETLSRALSLLGGKK